MSKIGPVSNKLHLWTLVGKKIGLIRWFNILYAQMRYEQNVREYYMLNYRIGDLLFQYKKVLFSFNFVWYDCFKKNASSVLQARVARSMVSGNER